jgi:mono/diheme cytochrome c family protein
MAAFGWSLALLAGGRSLAGEFAFQDLRQVLEERRVGDVEGLIAALPEDLRRHYTLVFSSRSLQEASEDHPRALLFGSTARLILSFNGDPGQRGFDAVETMEVEAATQHVLFREITFAPAGANAAAVISEPNPPRCAVCHGNPARPIWDLPPEWPGVYGERYGAGLSAPELRGMRRFLAVQPSHPRYRHLLGAEALAERDTYAAGSRQRYAGVAAEPPNARLSALLATINVRAILAQLAAQPGFAEHLDLLLAAAGSDCGSLAEFYPPLLQPAVAADLDRFSAAARAADRQASDAKEWRVAGRPTARAASAPVDLIALRYVAERALHVSTQGWTLAFERGSYDLTPPPGTPTLAEGLFAWSARTDPDLRTMAAYRTFDANDRYCAHLRGRSRLSLASWYRTHDAGAVGGAAPAPAPAAGPPPLLQRCAACHDSGVAPALPFSQPEALAARLQGGGYPRGRLLDEILYRLTPQAGPARMPRGMNLDAAQQRELEDYFLQLARSR